MKASKIINIKSNKPYDVYIGRANRIYRLPSSIWANPFQIGRDGSRQEVLWKYRKYLISRPDLMYKLQELRGKTLACWCKPDGCHGDILLGLLRDRESEKEDIRLRV